jgi:hypothetical protein
MLVVEAVATVTVLQAAEVQVAPVVAATETNGTPVALHLELLTQVVAVVETHRVAHQAQVVQALLLLDI